MVRRLLLAAAAVGVLAPALHVPAAESATLIEARIDERPARLVVDEARQRVLVSVAGERKLVDVAHGVVYQITADGAAHRFRVGGSAPAPNGLSLNPWGPGPRIAGYPTTYHVVTAGERICAEVLVSDRRDGFMAVAARALDLIERAEAMSRRPSRGPLPADACAAPPFAAYAARGWPIMAGLRDRALFETVAVRFGYVPVAEELDAPTRVADAPMS